MGGGGDEKGFFLASTFTCFAIFGAAIVDSAHLWFVFSIRCVCEYCGNDTSCHLNGSLLREGKKLNKVTRRLVNKSTILSGGKLLHGFCHIPHRGSATATDVSMSTISPAMNGIYDNPLPAPVMTPEGLTSPRPRPGRLTSPRTEGLTSPRIEGLTSPRTEGLISPRTSGGMGTLPAIKHKTLALPRVED